MRLRQRQEAEGRARRWLLAGQAATLAVALALVVGLFGSELAGAAKAAADALQLANPLLVAAAVAATLLVPLGGWLASRST